ncbi:MAG: class I SAM-dependent methyltransferase, partial [Patescibacteria group bacterium]
KKAKIITSISMFYDLPEPLDFVNQVKDTLADDGIWILEQSYMPTMVDMVSYDTVCHEHLEYYGLKQIKWLVDAAGMKIVDVALNDVNGGSFQVVVSKDINAAANDAEIERLLRHEEEGGYSSGSVFAKFREEIETHKKQVLDFFKKASEEGKTVYGYGSSTKGNVTLQYCGITNEMLPRIAEVNEYKFGRTSPGTKIPIISETEAHAAKPDYYFVLPWHFRKGIIERESAYLASGGHLVFPLPQVEIV